MYVLIVAMFTIVAFAISNFGPTGPVSMETQREARAVAIAENVMRAHHHAIQFIWDNRYFEGEIPAGANSGKTVYVRIRNWPSIRDADGRIITYVTPAMAQDAGLSKAGLEQLYRVITEESGYSRTIGFYENGYLTSRYRPISPSIPIRSSPGITEGSLLVTTKINE